MPKFQGPTHITSITLASGPLAIVDGIAEIHEPTAGDVAGLMANGFALIAEGAYFATPAPEPEDEPAPAITKAKPAKEQPSAG